jgi:hypothetical protein
VQDLAAHLAQHPEQVAEGTACIRVLRVNAKTLSLFGARDTAELLGGLGRVFRDDMFDAVVAEWSQLWNGQLEFATRPSTTRWTGGASTCWCARASCKAMRTEWDRVMVSLEDISDTTRNLQRLGASEQYARDLFEHSPVSLWVEDFSAVKQLLDEARHQGITDFPTFIRVHPEFVTRCMQEIRVVDVNQLTLSMFGAASKTELLSHLDRLFRDEMVDSSPTS